MRFVRSLSALTMALLLVFLAGCASDSAQTEPPDGWNADDGRWWQADVDTAQAFRDLSSLATMGVEEKKTYQASFQGINRDQFERAVKQELVPIYRHGPETLDSLFVQYVQPMIQEATLSGDVRAKVNEFRSRGVKALREHFREPRAELSLGQDVPIMYPDSLRRPETSGRVEMQVYMNADGEPLALRRIRSVHPTLDAIAMNAATRMRWQPAYLLVDGEWVPQACWTRFTVNFSQGGG